VRGRGTPRGQFFARNIAPRSSPGTDPKTYGGWRQYCTTRSLFFHMVPWHGGTKPYKCVWFRDTMARNPMKKQVSCGAGLFPPLVLLDLCTEHTDPEVGFGVGTGGVHRATLRAQNCPRCISRTCAQTYILARNCCLAITDRWCRGHKRGPDSSSWGVSPTKTHSKASPTELQRFRGPSSDPKC
jgi:hypothetical protein